MYNTKEQIKAKGEELEEKLKTLCKEIEDFIYADIYDENTDNFEAIEELGKWNRLFYNKIIKHIH